MPSAHQDGAPVTQPRRIHMGLACAAIALFASRASAHGISEESRQTMTDGGIVDYIWLGAEHMVTGYDHLLFLFGVIFFLTGFRDIVRFITAFTLGHCITLLGATMAGITANAYLIDAVIALSVIYKGFENLDGFKKAFNIEAPNLLGMVFGFGLIHGFGLSTRLQELTLGNEGMVSKILAFNVGVELGQIAALSLMLAFFAAWRSTAAFARFDTIANIGLVVAGTGLFAMQIDGYMHDDHHHDDAAEEGDHSDHHDHHDHAHEANEQEPAAPNTVEAADAPEEQGSAPSQSENEPDPADEPADKAHGHKHGHGHEHGHSHRPKPEGVKPPVKKHTHTHGDGKPHSH